jgi:hypothetical protein
MDLLRFWSLLSVNITVMNHNQLTIATVVSVAFLNDKRREVSTISRKLWNRTDRSHRQRIKNSGASLRQKVHW